MSCNDSASLHPSIWQLFCKSTTQQENNCVTQIINHGNRWAIFLPASHLNDSRTIIERQRRK